MRDQTRAFVMGTGAYWNVIVTTPIGLCVMLRPAFRHREDASQAISLLGYEEIEQPRNAGIPYDGRRILVQHFPYLSHDHSKRNI